MIINNYKYGISILPLTCLASKAGYKYGAYKININESDNVHVTDFFRFFRSEEEIQRFVNEHPEYRRE